MKKVHLKHIVPKDLAKKMQTSSLLPPYKKPFIVFELTEQFQKAIVTGFQEKEKVTELKNIKKELKIFAEKHNLTEQEVIAQLVAQEI